MIFVTGAAGKTGLAVIRAVAEQGGAVRALVRRPAQEEQVRSAGAAEVLVGDLTDGHMLREGVRACTAVYHLAPNMHPAELAIGRELIGAAQADGVTHIVYHSVLHPQTEGMPHHWQKLRVEEVLFAAGIPFTILQPAAYMQNMLAKWTAITTTGDFSNPYPVSTRLSLVDLADVAAAAATVLQQPGHEYAVYELVGTPPLAQTAVAQILSAELHRAVVAREIPLAEWEAEARAAGLPFYAVETLVKMFRYYARNGLEGNPNVLQMLLGRPPTTVAQFIRRQITAD